MDYLYISVISFLFVCLVIFVYLFIVYTPLSILVIRHFIDDKSWYSNCANRQGRIINSDGTAFNGSWLPVIIAVCSSFIFILLVVL